MPRANRVCSVPGCPEVIPAGTGSRCHTHRRTAEQQRGTARQRGYDHKHETRFRPGVLRRDPLCVCEDTSHRHPAPCGAISTVADHHPHSRRELVRLGLDPNDPRHGRGLCADCHNKHTAQAQPGGWYAR